MNILVDTCVLIDVISKRENFYHDSLTVLACAANNNIHGYTTVKSLMDLYYVIKKVTNNDRKTRDIIENTTLLLKTLDSTYFALNKALKSNAKDFEDALMIETAKENNIDCIITRNVKDFKNSEVQILTPHEFVSKLETIN